jgi:hypothetical protein
MGQRSGKGLAGKLSPESSELVERGDLDELTIHVNGLVAEERWAELDALRELCRRALERGKQLWAVAAHIEYRLCLEAPGRWAALMLETGTGRFALGPLPEVAASTHTWAELSPHLHATPQAAMAGHERVLRGDDLSHDRVAGSLPEVLDLPLHLEAWEPSYALAEYRADRMEAPPPRMPPFGPVPAGPRADGPRADGPGPASRRAEADEVSTALEELVTTWTVESNGRAEAVAVCGGALDAISALGTYATALVELGPATALAIMAWAGADGGAHGRRRGAAPGRFAAWWALAALGGLIDQWPPRPDDLRRAAEDARWYAWESRELSMGWTLRLAIEAASGPHKGRAWAVAAVDAAY